MGNTIYKKKHFSIKYFIIFPLVIFLYGCQSSKSEFFIMSDPNCKPPCWHNIIPGISSEPDVISALENDLLVNQETITVRGKPWKIFNDAIYFLSNTDNIKGEIYFIDNKVALITISGDLNLSFGQVIDYFGNPEYIINIPLYNGLPLSSNLSNEITAINTLKGIVFSYNTSDIPGSQKIKLLPENKITRINFFNPNEYENMLDAGLFSEGLLDAGEAKEYMNIWSGYGDIDQKYPPAIIK